jgi:hypothetical protein
MIAFVVAAVALSAIAVLLAVRGPAPNGPLRHTNDNVIEITPHEMAIILIAKLGRPILGANALCWLLLVLHVIDA